MGQDLKNIFKMVCVTKARLHLFTTVEYTLQNTEQKQPVTKQISETFDAKMIPEINFGWYRVHRNCTSSDILIRDSF